MPPELRNEAHAGSCIDYGARGGTEEMSTEWVVVHVSSALRALEQSGCNLKIETIKRAIAARPAGPDVPLLIDASELAELRRDAEMYRAQRDDARARIESQHKILSAIYARLWPTCVSVDGKTFLFTSEKASLWMQELSDRIRAIPDELAAIAQEKANG